METNLYNTTIPTMIKGLKALSGIFDKALAHATAKSSERAPVEKHLDALLNDRLVFDQYPFIRQIQIATDNAKGAAGRLAEIEIPKYEDTEKTLEELRARVAKTIAFLESVKPEQVIGKEEIKIELPFMPGQYLTGFEYATEFAVPNFLFHLTTAYSILRKNGVDIGKSDFMGSLPMKEVPKA